MVHSAIVARAPPGWSRRLLGLSPEKRAQVLDRGSQRRHSVRGYGAFARRVSFEAWLVRKRLPQPAPVPQAGEVQVASGRRGEWEVTQMHRTLSGVQVPSPATRPGTCGACGAACSAVRPGEFTRMFQATAVGPADDASVQVPPPPLLPPVRARRVHPDVSGVDPGFNRTAGAPSAAYFTAEAPVTGSLKRTEHVQASTPALHHSSRSTPGRAAPANSVGCSRPRASSAPSQAPSQPSCRLRLSPRRPARTRRVYSDVPGPGTALDAPALLRGQPAGDRACILEAPGTGEFTRMFQSPVPTPPSRHTIPPPQAPPPPAPIPANSRACLMPRRLVEPRIPPPAQSRRRAPDNRLRPGGLHAACSSLH